LKPFDENSHTSIAIWLGSVPDPGEGCTKKRDPTKSGSTLHHGGHVTNKASNGISTSPVPVLSWQAIGSIRNCDREDGKTKEQASKHTFFLMLGALAYASQVAVRVLIGVFKRPKYRDQGDDGLRDWFKASNE